MLNDRPSVRQRRTDFSGIVGVNATAVRRQGALAVNGGRISQVLWVRLVHGFQRVLGDPSTEDGFLRYCGHKLQLQPAAPLVPVNEGRISQVL